MEGVLVIIDNTFSSPWQFLKMEMEKKFHHLSHSKGKTSPRFYKYLIRIQYGHNNIIASSNIQAYYILTSFMFNL
jgi:hypothetical protein